MGSNPIKPFIFHLLTYLSFNEDLPICDTLFDTVINKVIHAIKAGLESASTIAS